MLGSAECFIKAQIIRGVLAPNELLMDSEVEAEDEVHVYPLFCREDIWNLGEFLGDVVVEFRVAVRKNPQFIIQIENPANRVVQPNKRTHNFGQMAKLCRRCKTLQRRRVESEYLTTRIKPIRMFFGEFLLVV